MQAKVQCKCGEPLEPLTYCTGQMHNCSICNATVQVRAYPALVTLRAAPKGEALIDCSQASCFYHPSKKASAACEMCGRFLCNLCLTPLGGRQMCIRCYEKENQAAGLTCSRILQHDKMGVVLALIPSYGITALLAVFVAIRYWNTPMSVLPRTRIRHVLALILGLMQIGGTTWLIWHIYSL